MTSDSQRAHHVRQFSPSTHVTKKDFASHDVFFVFAFLSVCPFLSSFVFIRLRFYPFALFIRLRFLSAVPILFYMTII